MFWAISRLGIENNKINCDLTGDRNFEIAHHPDSFNDLKYEAEIYKKEFNIETEIYSKKEFEEIGHSGQEQFGAFSYKPGFAINPLKFVLAPISSISITITYSGLNLESIKALSTVFRPCAIHHVL